jgi:hypothetical protein
VDRILRNHPALAITLAYLLVSFIGAAFSWALFSEFGINYFVFAEVNDLLFAVMREPLAALAAASGALVVWLLTVYARWERGKLGGRENAGFVLRWYLRSNGLHLDYPVVRAVAFLLYIFLFVTLYADFRADSIRDGALTPVRVVQAEPGSGPAVLTGGILGSSARFLFLYIPDQDRVVVLPDEAIGAIEFHED